MLDVPTVYDPPATTEAPTPPGLPLPPTTDAHGNPRGTRYFRMERTVKAVVVVRPKDIAMALADIESGAMGRGYGPEDAAAIAAHELADCLSEFDWEVIDSDLAVELDGPRGQRISRRGW